MTEDPCDVRSLSLTWYSGHHVHPHRHQWGQLIHASTGVMRVVTDGQVWITPPTRAIWIPPGHVHEFSVQGESAFRTLYIAPLRCAEIDPVVCALEVPPLLRELILQICAHDALDPGDPHQNRLAGLLVDLIISAPRLDVMLPLPRDPRALRLASHFQDLPGDKAALPELATTVGASVRTLQRSFAAETGISVDRWRQKARLVAAAAMLARGESVTNTALDCGYDSASAFITAFKRQFGKTPRQFARA